MADSYSTSSQPSHISMDAEGDDHFDIDDNILNMGSPQAVKGQTGMERFMNEPHFADRSFQIHPAIEDLPGGPLSTPTQPAHHNPMTDLASSLSSSDLSTETSDILSRFPTNSTTSPSVTSISESAHQPDPSIMLGALPSRYTRSVVPDFNYHDYHDHATPAHNTHDSLSDLICILGVIDDDISRCHEASLIGGSDALYRHSLTHFHPVGPPGYALCIFCNAAFDNAAKPKEVWKEWATHLCDSHFRNGANINDSRPDFRTVRYMLEKNLITQERYDWICHLANERKGKQYADLKPADWVSDKSKLKQYLAEEEEHTRENLVVVKNDNRRRQQGRSEREGRRYHR